MTGMQTLPGTRLSRIPRLFALFVCVLLSSGAFARAASEDPVFKAMSDEMNRSRDRLRMDDFGKPYFLSYCVSDEDRWEMEAAWGGLVASDQEQSRWLLTSLRVGDYSFDNSRYSPGWIQGFFNAQKGDRLPLDSDYDAVRRALWMATDRAYKTAVEGLSKKKASQQNTASVEKLDSFTRETPAPAVEEKGGASTWNRERWQSLCMNLSRIFNRFPEIRTCSVRILLRQGQTRFLSTEGSRQQTPFTLGSLVVNASSRAVDGMPISDHICLFAKSESGFPSESDLTRQVEDLARRLVARREGAALESWSGPVLFEGQAAGQFFRQLLAKNLCLNPPISFENKSFEQIFKVPESVFRARLGSRVLPDFLSVTDDPLAVDSAGRPLLGSYGVDSEGVAAQRVSLVEKGVLKGFLTSRSPVKAGLTSNGHGRTLVHGEVGTHAGNLLVRPEGGKTEEELKQELINLCRAQNREFGILVRSLDRKEAKVAETRLAIVGGMLKGMDGNRSLGAPVDACRVYVDGHVEPVRNLEFVSPTPALLRGIVAASSSCGVFDFMDTTGTVWERGGTGDGVPATIVAPSVLVEEVEFKRSDDKPEKPEVLPSPLVVR